MRCCTKLNPGLIFERARQAAYEAGLAAGGGDDGPPGPRPQYGPRYYCAYLRDPDGLRVEVVCGAH